MTSIPSCVSSFDLYFTTVEGGPHSTVHYGKKRLQNRKNLSVKSNFWKYLFDITNHFLGCFVWQILNLNIFLP